MSCRWRGAANCSSRCSSNPCGGSATSWRSAGESVYEGMIVGENARAGDMVVNVTREKQKTNIRTHASDEAIKLAPPRPLTIESAIELIGDDELVEITPSSIRARKRLLREPD